jgi:nucleoside-diphosphate-sugar epimerase
VIEVLVTGGNGFVGRYLVSALLERHDRVRVLALPGEDTRWLECHGIRVYQGDIRKPKTLSAAMEGADGVVHLAAMMDVWRPLDHYHGVNVTGTENVCRAAVRAGVRRIVHMSSSSVYGVGINRPADERAPLSPFRDPYPITKAAGDSLVQRMIAEEHLPAAIIRPDQIFGPGDHMHFRVTADRLRSGRGVIVGRGDNALPLVFITDVVQGLLLALHHPRAVGQAYNITSDEPLTQRQFLEAIARAIGARPPRLRLPYRALYAAGYLVERLAKIKSSPRRPPITRLGVAFLGTDNRFAIDKARRQLGYRPRVPIDEGVKAAAAWYRQMEYRRRPQATDTRRQAEEVFL